MSNVSKLKFAKPDILAIVDRIGPGFAPTANEADETDSFVAAHYDVLKASGLVEAAVPAELGGGGANITELANMLRTLAHYCGSTALAFAMHTHNVTVPAWRWQYQSIAAVEPLLKRVAAEKIILLTSGGSDWVSGSGKAVKVEGGYKITARKAFASAAPVGNLLMTSAVLEEDGKAPVVLHFGVPMNSPQVRIDPVWKTMGMRGTGSHDVVIDGHFVPDAGVALQRKAGEWHPLFQIIASIAIPLVYSVYVGVAEQARNIALDMVKRRRPDPNITQLVGRMETELRGAQLAWASMLEAANRNAPSAATVNDVMMGRALVARHAIAAVEFAMEAAGGAGFFRAAGLERCFRDVQGARYHPMQMNQQSNYAGAMALGQPIDKIY